MAVTGFEFPVLVSFDSKQKGSIHKWVKSKINYKEERKWQPHSFDKDVSFCGCRLPSLMHLGPQFQYEYSRAVLDKPFTHQLEKCQALNWCPTLVRLEAVAVPQDGNTLLHAASLAMWSVFDEQFTLRELLLRDIVVNSNESYKQRWWRQKLLDLSRFKDGSKIINKEWEEVVRSISSLNKASIGMSTPSEFLESVHIYVLSNILRRPIIIVTAIGDPSTESNSREDTHIAGVYLPLEWPPLKCHKSPLILGYTQGKFCPLLSEAPLQPDLVELPFPLVTRDFCSLSVRFLNQAEEHRASELIQSYFIIKEAHIPIGTNGEAFVPCAVLDYKDLPTGMNVLQEHFEVCEQRRFQALSQAGEQNEQTEAMMMQQLHLNSQTKVAPMRSFNDSYQMNMRNQAARGKEHSQRDLSKTNLAGERHGIVERCIVRGCERQGDASKSNFCEICFEKFRRMEPLGDSVSSPELHEASLNYHGGNAGSGLVSRTETATCIMPTAPPASLLNSMEEPQSMLGERCHNKCGYRCSTNTYPYCHECFKLVQVQQEVASAPNPSFNAEGLSFLGLMPFPASNINQPQGNLMLFSPSPTQNLSNPLAHSGQEREGNRNDDEHNKLPEETFEKPNLVLSKNSVAAEPRPKRITPEPRAERQVIPGKEKEMSNLVHKLFPETTEPMKVALSEKKQEEENVIYISAESTTCVSPYCKELVSSPDKLCAQCQAVLRKAQKQSAGNVTPGSAIAAMSEKLQTQKLHHIQSGQMDSPRLQHVFGQEPRPRQRGKPCVSPGCSNYGDPIHADRCSSCYEKVAMREFEKFRRQHASSRTDKIVIPSVSSSHKVPAKPVKANTVNLPVSTFATNKSSLSSHSIHHGSLENFSTIDIKAFNQGFEKEYEKFRDQSSSGLKRCKTPACGNYGNTSKHGYCNSCAAQIEQQRQEERIARFGKNVPDGWSTQQNSI